MQDFTNQKILVGISGGIAAYKSAHLVRELKKQGADVKVVMTSAATQFVTALTFQALSGHPVLTSLWQEDVEHGMDHIALARWADIFIIVPATANIIAKMAQGMADDLLSTLYLVVTIPVWICPAMNQSMWQHPATQANIQLLLSRNVRIIPPEEGEAACGETGVGRLCEVTHLLQYLRLPRLALHLSGVSCVITAGPTKERIDPVRYLSNDSSGKMGYALAYAAQFAGAKVTLITGPTALIPPPHISVIKVNTAAEMNQAVMASLTPDCLFIAAAAVADFSIINTAQEKIKKHKQDTLALSCVRTQDILSNVVKTGLASYVVGFAAETQDVIAKAKEKLLNKQVNLIIANQVGPGLGFEQDYHQVSLITQEEERALAKQHKTRLAGEIIRFIANVSSLRRQGSLASLSPSLSKVGFSSVPERQL